MNSLPSDLWPFQFAVKTQAGMYKRDWQVASKLVPKFSSCWSFIPGRTWLRSPFGSWFNSCMKLKTVGFYQRLLHSSWPFDMKRCGLGFRFTTLGQLMYPVHGFASFSSARSPHPSPPPTSSPLSPAPFFSQYCHPRRFTRSPLRGASGHKSLQHTVKAHPLGWI